MKPRIHISAIGMVLILAVGMSGCHVLRPDPIAVEDLAAFEDQRIDCRTICDEYCDMVDGIRIEKSQTRELVSTRWFSWKQRWWNCWGARREFDGCVEFPPPCP